MSLTVYWLFALAVRQYSRVRCSLVVKEGLLFRMVEPERILKDSSLAYVVDFLMIFT